MKILFEDGEHEPYGDGLGSFTEKQDGHGRDLPALSPPEPNLLIQYFLEIRAEVGQDRVL